MPPSPPPEPGTTRRAIVLGGCAGAVAACLAGCARYGEAQSTPAPPPGGAGSAPTGGAGSSGSGTGIALAAARVPVGGGVVLADQGVVITQPRAGTFAAFGTTCPHEGCAVSDVADGLITCPCHGSEFRIADGRVAQGPAQRGLSRRRVSVEGGQVRVV